MDIVVFEHDQDYVLEAFRRGEFDFVDGLRFRQWGAPAEGFPTFGGGEKLKRRPRL